MLNDIPITLDMLHSIADEAEGDVYFLQTEELFTGKTLTGEGKIRFKNGNIYKGEIHNGIIEGQGDFIWKDGVRYRGNFLANSLQGKGRYDWPDGSYYEGEIVNGLRHGKGTFKTSANKEDVIYVGDWKDGLKHGQGQLRYVTSG